ncbi:MAG: hypothetical protein ACODAJ_05535 [Planctomycetota bacterium]
MAKLREKMETQQFLRLVAEARRRYTADPLLGPTNVDEPAEPKADEASENADETRPESSRPTLRREESPS